MFEALKAGLEREVIQYKIDEAPNRAGDLRQRATEIDAAALNYSCIDRIMFDFGRIQNILETHTKKAIVLKH